MFSVVAEREEANGPIARQLQRVCQDTLLWLISLSLGRVGEDQ